VEEEESGAGEGTGVERDGGDVGNKISISVLRKGSFMNSVTRHAEGVEERGNFARFHCVTHAKCTDNFEF